MMWSFKQERPTTQYIWRTRQDGKVWSAHAGRKGQIFSWDDLPEGGHPREGHNCRCTAEPYFIEVSDYIRLFIDGIGTKSRWSNSDFVNHYFNGLGRAVTLAEIGHHRKIIKAFIELRGDALKQEIARAARGSRSGSVSYNFENTYEMTGVVFSAGNTMIGGSFSG